MDMLTYEFGLSKCALEYVCRNRLVWIAKGLFPIQHNFSLVIRHDSHMCLYMLGICRTADCIDCHWLEVPSCTLH